MALLDGPLLFPNSPGTGLLSRARNWWNSDLDRQERLRAMFSGWAQGTTPQESLGLGAAAMQDARGDIRERRQQEEASRAIMGLLGGDAVSPGAFPTLSNPGAPRAVSGGLLGGGASVQPQQGMAGYDAGMDPDVTGGPVRRPVSFVGLEGMNAAFSDPLSAFLAAAPGGGITVGSGYRTVEQQQQLWNAKVAEVRAANPGLSQAEIEEIADNTVARPGQSNHNHGRAADLQYANDAAREWAHANAANYGLRFPMSYEPWHIELANSPAGAASAMGTGGRTISIGVDGGTIVDPFSGQSVGQGPNPAFTRHAGTGGLSQRALDIMRIMMMPGAQAQMPVLQVLLQQEMAANAPQSLDPTDDMTEFLYAQQNPAFAQFLDRNEQQGDQWQHMQGEDGNIYAFNPRTGETRLSADMPDAPEGPDITGEGTLRREFDGITSTFRTVNDAFQKLVAVGRQGTPAGDLSLLYNYVKLLDPGSVVRESEFETASSARPLLERLGISWDAVSAVWEGNRLTPGMRDDFLLSAQKLFESQLGDYQARADYYRGLAQQYGFNPDRIVPQRDFSVPPIEPTATAEATAPTAPTVAPQPAPAPDNSTALPRAPAPYFAPQQSPAPPPVSAPAAPVPQTAPAAPQPGQPQPFAAIDPPRQAALRAIASQLLSMGKTPEQIIAALRERGYDVTAQDLGL